MSAAAERGLVAFVRRPYGGLLRRLPLLAVALGVVAALVVIALQTSMNEVVRGDVGLMPALIVVLLVAWVGGLLPALAATATAALGHVWLYTAPVGSLAVSADRDRLELGLFVATAIVASSLLWLRIVAEERARRLREEALQDRARADLLARRLGALQALGAELARSDTSARMVDLLVEHAQVALKADGAAAFVIDRGASELTVLGSRGFDGSRQERLSHVSLDLRLPATDAARTGESVYVETPAEYLERYGQTYRELGLEMPSISAAAVPLELDGRRFGALGFTWQGRYALPGDRREFIESLAQLGAAALDRARLSDQQRTSLARLEAAQRRVDLLAEAGRVLGLTLDFESTLRRVASLAIPMLGDVGLVDIIDGDRVRRLVAVSSNELTGPASVLEQHPIDVGDACPIASVLETGQSVTYPCDVEDSGPTGHDAQQTAALRAIGARWLHSAPLKVSDRTIGALTFLRRQDHGFEPEELATAAQLAERAAHALENARLHGQVRRLAERESRRAGELEAVIGAVNEGFLVVDGEGFVQSSNAAAARLLGARVTTMVDIVDRLISSGDAVPVLGPEPAEYRLRDRPAAWVEVAAYPVARAGLASPSTVVVCRDVTAFRQGQALREAFLGLLSHELRTPVTTIYGGAAVLTRRSGQLADGTAEAVLADIAAEADRLYRLVEDLLVLARFDEGFELGQEPVLLQRLVPAVVEQERGRWPASRFDVQVRPDVPAASGDETSITQVLRNLLSNASKYSGPGATITVVVEDAGHGPAVRVLDEGPGVDPTESDHLFDAFYRSPATATLAGGAGIGLYVSRRLVDAMGGRIWAMPRAGRGSEFGFCLPAYAAEEFGEDEEAGEKAEHLTAAAAMLPGAAIPGLTA